MNVLEERRRINEGNALIAKKMNLTAKTINGKYGWWLEMDTRIVDVLGRKYDETKFLHKRGHLELEDGKYYKYMYANINHLPYNKSVDSLIPLLEEWGNFQINIFETRIGADFSCFGEGIVMNTFNAVVNKLKEEENE